MIEVLIAYDDLDAELGVFFTLCKDDSIEIINSIDTNKLRINFSLIPGINCNQAYLTLAHNRLADEPFIIAMFTHGNENSTVANGINFIQSSNDNSFFSNSFFYTNSCASGDKLGPSLIEQECRVFIGYKEKVYSFKNEYQEISLKCDTIGLTTFLTEDITAYQAYRNMIQLYSQESKKMRKNRDVLAAGLMIDAREALIFLGDKDARSHDFSTAI